MPARIAIIGGGISGLTAAHHLRELDPDVDVIVLEARDRVGGVLRTRQEQGALLEAAADGFLTEPEFAMQLCRRLGLGDELIGTDPSRRHAAVVHRGRLCPIPPGFLVMAPSRILPLLTTPILSWRGKLRMALEYLLPARRGVEDESLAAFVRRRFGREAFDRLVQPLLGGIYAADCEQLSLAATMPRFQQMEREHGSLIRAMRRKSKAAPTPTGSGARYGQFVSLRGGMGAIVQALQASLPADAIRTGAPVESLEPVGETQWALTIGPRSAERLEVDGVIIAAPAHQAATLTSDFDPQLGELLAGITYNSCAVVSLLYERSQIAVPIAGCGFVVPLVEQQWILSGSFANLKYAGRAPEGTLLLRVFIGGGCHPGLMRLKSTELQALAHHSAAALLGITGDPTTATVDRHTQAMPEYHVGHLELVTAIEDRLQRHSTLGLAGNAYRGVGVPHCIRSGEAAAERVNRAVRTTAGRRADRRELTVPV